MLILAMARVKPLKPCALCHTPAALCYRIQYSATAGWVLVCPNCQQNHSHNNPHYRYGGTWKASPNKR